MCTLIVVLTGSSRSWEKSPKIPSLSSLTASKVWVPLFSGTTVYMRDIPDLPGIVPSNLFVPAPRWHPCGSRSSMVPLMATGE